MKTETINKIIAGYERQLENAVIAKNTELIKWLKEQINEGNYYIAQFGTYTE